MDIRIKPRAQFRKCIGGVVLCAANQNFLIACGNHTIIDMPPPYEKPSTRSGAGYRILTELLHPILKFVCNQFATISLLQQVCYDCHDFTFQVVMIIIELPGLRIIKYAAAVFDKIGAKNVRQ